MQLKLLKVSKIVPHPFLAVHFELPCVRRHVDNTSATTEKQRSPQTTCFYGLSAHEEVKAEPLLQRD